VCQRKGGRRETEREEGVGIGGGGRRECVHMSMSERMKEK
jgi:hypothetical protein